MRLINLWPQNMNWMSRIKFGNGNRYRWKVTLYLSDLNFETFSNCLNVIYLSKFCFGPFAVIRCNTLHIIYFISIPLLAYMSYFLCIGDLEEDKINDNFTNLSNIILVFILLILILLFYDYDLEYFV